MFYLCIMVDLQIQIAFSSLKHMQQCLLVFCDFLRDRFLFRFIKPSNKSKLPFAVFCHVSGAGDADVLTWYSTSERTQLILKNVMIQLLNTFLIYLIKINHNICLD